jgi:hypothetical protein
VQHANTSLNTRTLTLNYLEKTKERKVSSEGDKGRTKRKEEKWVSFPHLCSWLWSSLGQLLGDGDKKVVDVQL